MRRNRKHQKERSRSSRVANSHRRTSAKSVGKSNKKELNPTLKRIIYGFFACLFVVLAACLGIGAGMYAAIVDEIDEMNINQLALTRSSIVYYNDKDGNSDEAATLFSDGNRIWLESHEISDIMKDAIVSIEDERFYDHSGVDIKRTTGAVFGYIGELFGQGTARYGGSTITQQVIKNITQEKDRTAARKIKEMMRAVAIEKQLSKDEILTIYLNVIFLANNCYGVEAASNIYFDKSAADLELHEAALIAGITQRPSYYDPLRNPENAVEKRNTVLAKMYELGKITQDEYEEAKNKDIDLKGNHRQAKSRVYSYFIDNVISEVIKDLQTEKGYTETFATQQVFGGGLKIYTTMDYDIQTAIENVFENSQNFTGGASKAQAAMVIIDPHTGEIKGMVGGKGEKTDSRGLNRATQTTRQPGSSIKPLSVYAPSLDTKVITPATILKDEPIKIGKWEPKNSYTGFKGDITVKRALSISANIPSIKVLRMLGVTTSFDYAKNKFGLSTLTNEDKDLSPLSLGGLTNGVTVRDMAGAYSVFANGGYYIEPYSYTKVLDSTNRVLLDRGDVSKTRVIKESTAALINDMLYSVVNTSGGTGTIAKLSDMPCYGKTGTTNNDNDKWFVGYTKYYVGAVWFGFDKPSSIRAAGIRSNISAQLWKKVMQQVHEGLEPEKIDVPGNMKNVYICSQTGDLAVSTCNSILQLFESGTQPKSYCSGVHYNDDALTLDSGEETPPTEEQDASQTPTEDEQNDGSVSPEPPVSEGVPDTTPITPPQDEAVDTDQPIQLD